MRKICKCLTALLLVCVIVFSFAACSSNGGSSADANPALQTILDNFKDDEQYNEYKSMYIDTTFEEKVAGDSIVIDISGNEGVSGSYEFVLDGDYLTYTEPADSDDYIGISFFMYLMTAADEYLGMDANLVTGYISGCEAFGVENKYYLTETDDEAGTTTTKIYIAGKWDMPELDTMYVNDKALEYTDALDENDINGVINCGKIRVIYYGNKDSVDIVVSEYGERSNLTYQSIMNTVAKLQPTGSETFAKLYTELKEDQTKDDSFKVTFGLDDTLKAERELEELEGYDYTVVHFGK